MSSDMHDLLSRMADELDHYRQLLSDDRREVHALATEARAVLARWGRPAAPPAPETPAESLAVRPLLEQVARLGDCIGANTVGQITAISDRAAAWLRDNPPGQPVAVEPRGCPTPGACSCVEPAAPPAPEPGEVAELVNGLNLISDGMDAMGHESDSWFVAHAIPLPQQQAAPAPMVVPVAVSERPWERDGWCDEQGRCWMGRPLPDAPDRWDWSSAVTNDNATHCLPHDIPVLPAMIAALPVLSGEGEV